MSSAAALNQAKSRGWARLDGQWVNGVHEAEYILEQLAAKSWDWPDGCGKLYFPRKGTDPGDPGTSGSGGSGCRPASSCGAEWGVTSGTQGLGVWYWSWNGSGYDKKKADLPAGAGDWCCFIQKTGTCIPDGSIDFKKLNELLKSSDTLGNLSLLEYERALRFAVCSAQQVRGHSWPDECGLLLFPGPGCGDDQTSAPGAGGEEETTSGESLLDGQVSADTLSQDAQSAAERAWSGAGDAVSSSSAYNGAMSSMRAYYDRWEAALADGEGEGDVDIWKLVIDFRDMPIFKLNWRWEIDFRRMIPGSGQCTMLSEYWGTIRKILEYVVYGAFVAYLWGRLRPRRTVPGTDIGGAS